MVESIFCTTVVMTCCFVTVSAAETDSAADYSSMAEYSSYAEIIEDTAATHMTAEDEILTEYVYRYDRGERKLRIC